MPRRWHTGASEGERSDISSPAERSMIEIYRQAFAFLAGHRDSLKLLGIAAYSIFGGAWVAFLVWGFLYSRNARKLDVPIERHEREPGDW